MVFLGAILAARKTNDLRYYPLAAVSIFALFAIWGFAQRVNEAIGPQFSDFFHLTASQATWTEAVFGASLFLLAIPASMFLRNFGYKLGVVFGLSSFSVGALLLYPAIAQHEYLYFLGAVAVLGAGWTWLETSANPLVVGLGSPDTAVRRLNLAQSCYPIGVIAGYEVGKWLARLNLSVPDGQLTQAVVRPYLLVGLCVLLAAFLIENLEFPSIATEHVGKDERIRDEISALLARPVFRMDMLALASCIFAHSALWSIITRFAQPSALASSAPPTVDLLLIMFVVYGAGRIVGTELMYRFEPNRLLAAYAAASVALTLTALAVGGRIGIFCLLSTNFFLSIMYPTIFATSVRSLGRLAKSASGLLVTGMGLAASVTPLAMAFVVAISGQRMAPVLPALFFGIVLIYAQTVRHEESRAEIGGRSATLAH